MCADNYNQLLIYEVHSCATLIHLFVSDLETLQIHVVERLQGRIVL